jgi:hypothetical protein
MNYHVSTQAKRLLENGRHHRVVDGQQHSGVIGDSAQAANIADSQQRIAGGLDQDKFGAQ